jgi:hypothetical protein
LAQLLAEAEAEAVQVRALELLVQVDLVAQV